MALSKIDSDGIVSGGITADSLNIGQIGGRRNLIINGDMAISQRNTSFTNPLNQYTLDRWISQLDTTSARSTVTQESSGGPSGFRNFLRVTVTTADATLDSSDLQNIKQIIEGYNMRHTDQGTSDAETLTCSFWVRSSVTGTYSATLYLNSTGTQYAYPAEYTINSANTWEYKTVTFSPQTTSASWVSSGYTNGEYAQLRFGLMIGSGQGGTADTWNASNKFGASGQTNLFATNGATWDLTGVQLEVGSVATPFEHRSYGEELAACQRYYQSSYNMGVSPGSSVDDFAGNNGGQGVYHAFGTNVSGGVASSIGSFVTQMRTRPTVTVYDHSGNSGKITTFDSGSSPTANQSYNAVRQSQRQIIVRTYQSSIFGFEYLYEADAEL